MKHILTVLLMTAGSLTAPAQKHQLYGDAGISLSRFYPGISATYNYKPMRWFGIGVGVQGYFFYPTHTNPHQFVPAVYGDLRFTIRPRERDQVFAFLDVGAAFYEHTNDLARRGDMVYRVSQNNGVYTGLGLGYLRTLVKRRWGLYGSLKLVSNAYRTEEYNLVTQQESKGGWSRGTMVVSVGIRL